MKSFTGTLPDAGTPKAPLTNRSWEVLLPETPAELEDMALTVRQTRGRKAEADTYQVQVARDSHPLVLRLLSVTDPAQPDVYEVAVGLSVRSCTCQGFRRWGHCKHTSVIVDAVRRGVFAYWKAFGGRARG